jgi:TolB-like protein
MNSGKVFAELKRRNVYKVAVAYAVVGWLLIQVATQVFPFFEIPNWAVRLVVLLIAIGFPVALVLAWAFELTPEGIKRTEVADAEIEHRHHGAWIYITLASAALSLGLFFIGRYTAQPRRASEAATVSPKSIAVLPFENLSRDPDNAFFTDGVQDEILTDLSRIADLKVISRTSVLQYKSGTPRNLREIGQQLGGAHLVEGSVRRIANRVRVNAQLIDARNDAHLWGQSYDRDLADVGPAPRRLALRANRRLPRCETLVEASHGILRSRDGLTVASDWLRLGHVSAYARKTGHSEQSCHVC